MHLKEGSGDLPALQVLSVPATRIVKGVATRGKKRQRYNSCLSLLQYKKKTTFLHPN